MGEVQTVQNGHEVGERSGITLFYGKDELPLCTPLELEVVNVLLSPSPTISKLSEASKAKMLDVTPSRWSGLKRQPNVINALLQLYGSHGSEIKCAVPDIIKARIAHARTQRAGAVQSTELLLEMAGQIAPRRPLAITQITVEQVHTSVVDTVRVMAGGVKQVSENAQAETMTPARLREGGPDSSESAGAQIEPENTNDRGVGCEKFPK